MSDQTNPEYETSRETGQQFRKFDLDPISRENVLQTLDLNIDVIPEELKESILKSEWFSADDGRILVEIRNRHKLSQERNGLLYISDFDDTLFGATQWHEEEFRRLATDSKLRERGIQIPEDVGKNLYEHSKITVPGIKEPRYTPKLNLILVSVYAKALERGEPHQQAWEKTLSAFNSVKDDLVREGRTSLGKYDIDQDVIRCLLGNHTEEFLYDYFAKYFLEGTEDVGKRIIVSRGTIEDAFGQVYKIHTSGLLEQGLGTDVVLYTNDLKADALPILYQILPGSIENGTRIFDDNPTEINNYVSWARENGVKNWELIRVIQPDTKRKSYITENQPKATWGKEELRFELFDASSDAPKTDLSPHKT